MNIIKPVYKGGTYEKVEVFFRDFICMVAFCCFGADRILGFDVNGQFELCSGKDLSEQDNGGALRLQHHGTLY